MKRQNLTPFNDKEQAHGFWIVYNTNGSMFYKGQYVNYIKYGYWIDNWFINKPYIAFVIK